VCPCVSYGCRSRRTTPRFREARLPLARGRVDGDPGSTVFARTPGGSKGVDIRHRGGKATAPGQARAGCPKGHRGAEVFARWKAPRVVSRVVRSRGRIEGGLGGSHEPRARASVTSPWERRQGCQRQGVHASRREEDARRGEMSPEGQSVQPAEANRTVVKQAVSSPSLARERLTQGEPTMRGYWYEEVRWQKSVQRIARCSVRCAARQAGGVTLAEEHSARRADVRGGGFEVRTVRGSREAP